MAETALGFASRLGMARESKTFARVWPSAAAAAITAHLPFQSEAVLPVTERSAVATVLSGNFAEASDVLAESVSGPVQFGLSYNHLEFVLASLFGFAARRDAAGTLLPTEVSAPSGAYLHRFELATALGAIPWRAGEGFIAGDGLLAGERRATRFTYATQRGDEVWETRSSLITSGAFTFQPARVLFDVDVVGYQTILNSAVNPDLRTLPPVTFLPALFYDMDFLIGPQSDTTPLDSSNKVTVTALGLEFAATPHLQSTTESQPQVDEPSYEGERTISGSFTANRLVGGGLLQQWSLNKTPLMAQVAITGPVIGNSVPYSLTFYLPHVLLLDPGAGIDGPGAIRPTYQMEISAQAGAALAGFPVGTAGYRHVVLDVVSDLATHPILD